MINIDCYFCRYSELKKEVDGMAVLMNEVGDGDKLVVEEVEVTDSEEEEEEEEEDNEEDEEDEDDDDEDNVSFKTNVSGIESKSL